MYVNIFTDQCTKNNIPVKTAAKLPLVFRTTCVLMKKKNTEDLKQLYELFRSNLADTCDIGSSDLYGREKIYIRSYKKENYLVHRFFDRVLYLFSCIVS
jgi:hypothetical protein